MPIYSPEVKESWFENYKLRTQIQRLIAQNDLGKWGQAIFRYVHSVYTIYGSFSLMNRVLIAMCVRESPIDNQ